MALGATEVLVIKYSFNQAIQILGIEILMKSMITPFKIKYKFKNSNLNIWTGRTTKQCEALEGIVCQGSCNNTFTREVEMKILSD